MKYYIEESRSEKRCVVWQVKNNLIFKSAVIVFKRTGDDCVEKCIAYKYFAESKLGKKF